MVYLNDYMNKELVGRFGFAGTDTRIQGYLNFNEDGIKIRVLGKLYDSEGNRRGGSEVIFGEVENLGKVTLFNSYCDNARGNEMQGLEFAEQSIMAFELLVGINTDDKRT